MTKTTWRLLIVSAVVAIGTGLFFSCGASDNKDSDNDKTGTSLSFANDVDPILEKSCGGSTCHSSGSPYTNYLGNQTAFDGNEDSIKARITATNASVMPPSTSELTLSTADKTVLLNYIAQ